MGRRLLLAFALTLCCAAPAQAAFPWQPGGAPEGTVPNDLKDDYKFAASPEDGNLLTNASARELYGVRGASVADQRKGYPTAWQTTTGRPDVTIAVLDSGIKWNDRLAMTDLRRKLRLNVGELPTPRHDRTTSLEDGGPACSTFKDADDANGDGIVEVTDWACDSRVERDPAARGGIGVGPKDLLDPQDLLIAFSDGSDDDGNGFADDIAGWDFLDDDNDPYDDVQYGHGTGEARDSTAEADNGGSLGTCPNCTFVPLRVGDSFIADVDNFAQAALYATDNGALVIQEALGTLNNSTLARKAINYAYGHGVTVMASWADEAAEHHNQPSALPHVIVVNSVRKYDATFTPIPRSYLQLNGCTNFSPKVTMSVPSASCSSEAVGRGSGMAGLIVSAALDARGAGRIGTNGTCRRVGGDACVITPNEVRQLFASGTVDGARGADDVAFTSGDEPSCTRSRTPACTDPNANGAGDQTVVSPLATTKRYPARRGFDEFYGYGRVNAARATKRAETSRIPPEAEIDGPEWFARADPAARTLDVTGHVAAVRADDGGRYTCTVLVAPGGQPNDARTDASPAGDFEAVGGGECDGSTARSQPFDGVLASIDVARLRARFPDNAGRFDGREPGVGTEQTSNGRPNTMPYAFTIKVIVSAKQGGTPVTGEDRRQLFLHRDKDLLDAFPKQLVSDGASPPVFADLDGDARNELVLGTSDGEVHAFKPDGGELPGWPVSADPLPAHTAERAFASGDVTRPASAILASTVVGDLDGDGDPEVVAADLKGKLYAWSSSGRRRWTREADRDFSGAPLKPFVDVRRGKRYRTQHAFLGSPALGDLDGDGKLEVVAAAMDRHVYAFHADGSGVQGFPVPVVDPAKITGLDPRTHAPAFRDGIGEELDQGAIVDTPALGDLDGDGHPEIVIGTNEEYPAGDDGGINAGNVDTASVGALGQSGQLSLGNTRVYAIRPTGGDKPFLPGWPVKVGQVFTELLPVVGEGVTGSPVIGETRCPNGGVGAKVGTIPAAGPAYVFNPDGTSCLGKDPSNGKDRALATEPPAGAGVRDTPAFPVAGQPVFGVFGGGLSLLAPAAGVMRALDLAGPEYQGGQDQVAAWDPASGRFRGGFPVAVNDLEFLAGPAVADLDGKGGEDVVAGTSSLDLQAFKDDGSRLSDAWPKLTADWMVATPTVGTFGTRDDDPGARKVIATVTRLGSLDVYRTEAPACSPSSWPRFHHDQFNSGDARRDAIAPAPVGDASVTGATLRFTAPGDDGLCGRATRYEVFAAGGTPIPGAPAPTGAGARQEVALPLGVGPRVGVRAVDDQGNRGRLVRVAVRDGAVAGARCVASPVAVSARKIGPVALGAKAGDLVRRLRPRLGRNGTLRICVRGGHRVLVATSKSRAIVVATTARTRRGLRRGMRAPRGLRPVRGVKGLRRRGTLLVGVRRGRVSFVAVAAPGVARSPARLRRALRPLGLDR